LHCAKPLLLYYILIIAEIIGVKIVSIEKSLGFNPLNIPTFGGESWSLNQTAGALNWPIVFITSDIINDYFWEKNNYVNE
jgi:uncharacterized PurR-regulated membrane protein YhhQ (DUF165 family)